MSPELLSTEDFTRDQIENALDQLIEWVPEEADNINSNKEELVSLIQNDTIPAPGSYLLSTEYAIPDETSSDNLQLFELPSLTPCEEACGMVAFDVVLFVVGLFGLHISNQERLTRELLRELGPDTLRGLARAIHNFSAADGALAKAKALFSVLGGIWNAGGFKAVFKVLKDEMSWWQWAKTGAIMFLQIGAWFLTDGAAFIAEAALSIMSAEQLIKDSVAVGQECDVA